MELARSAKPESDLTRIKLAIWGTADIDRDVADIEKLIAEWREELSHPITVVQIKAPTYC